MRNDLASRLSAPSGPVLRNVCLAICLLSAGLAGVAIEAFGSLNANNMVPETSPLERPQPWIWVGVAVVSGLTSLRGQRRRELWFAMWMGLISCLAALRELDLHVLLNPESIEALGLEREQAMRYRLDWWTDPSVPGALRLAWGSVLATVGLALVAPLVLARVRWRRLLVRLDRFAWCLFSGVALLGAGFLADDLLRATGIGGTASLQHVEEGLELAGGALVLVAAALMVRKGHHERTVMLSAPAGPALATTVRADAPPS